MRCVDFELRMNEIMDDRLDPNVDRLLVSHAQQCECCQDLLRWNSAIIEAIPRTTVRSRSLVDEVVASAQSQWWSRPTLWAGLVAVAVLAAIAVNLPRGGDPSPEGPDANRELSAQAPDVAPSPIESAALWALLDQIPVDETRHVTDPIAGGIRPIRNSLGMAFEALRDTLPPNKRSRVPPPQAGFSVPVSLRA